MPSTPPADGARSTVNKHDDVITLVASRALGDVGAKTCVFGRDYWLDSPVELTKLDGVVQRVHKAVGGTKAPAWVAEVPGAAAPILAALEKNDAAPDRTVFWSPLAPSSLFVTSEPVTESDDVHVIAKGARVGAEPKPHATPDTKLAKAFRSVKLHKTAEERFVLGVVLEPNVVDTQDDFESPEDIRKAAHTFMEQFEQLGMQHTEIVTGKLKILESYIAPVDFQLGDDATTKVTKGTWVMGIRVVDDDLWTKVKKGSFTGFSIGGTAYRTEATLPEVGASTP
jgi:hypothetical protein